MPLCRCCARTTGYSRSGAHARLRVSSALVSLSLGGDASSGGAGSRRSSPSTSSVVRDRPQGRRVDVHRHRAAEAVDPMDRVSAEREGGAGTVTRHDPFAFEPKELAQNLACDDVDTATRAVMVVEHAVAGLPPGIEPCLGAVATPEENGFSAAAPVESHDVDERSSSSRDCGAALGMRRPGPIEAGRAHAPCADGCTAAPPGRGYRYERLAIDPSPMRAIAALADGTADRRTGCGDRARSRALALHPSRAHSSAGERSLHTREVPGSIPGAPISGNGFFKAFPDPYVFGPAA